MASVVWDHLIHRRLATEFDIADEGTSNLEFKVGEWFFRPGNGGSRTAIDGQEVCELMLSAPTDFGTPFTYHRATWKYPFQGLIGYYESGYADALERLPFNWEIYRGWNGISRSYNPSKMAAAKIAMKEYIKGFRDAQGDKLLEFLGQIDLTD